MEKNDFEELEKEIEEPKESDEGEEDDSSDEVSGLDVIKAYERKLSMFDSRVTKLEKVFNYLHKIVNSQTEQIKRLRDDFKLLLEEGK